MIRKHFSEKRDRQFIARHKRQVSECITGRVMQFIKGHKKESYTAVTLLFQSGATRNRTGDTRIFSPLLYQLSYGTMTSTTLFAGAKVIRFIEIANFSHFSRQSLGIYEKVRTFASAKRKVAQLVAHYVRDVGVGRSSRLFPTRKRRLKQFSLRFCFYHPPSTSHRDGARGRRCNSARRP